MPTSGHLHLPFPLPGSFSLLIFTTIHVSAQKSPPSSLTNYIGYDIVNQKKQETQTGLSTEGDLLACGTNNSGSKSGLSQGMTRALDPLLCDSLGVPLFSGSVLTSR